MRISIFGLGYVGTVTGACFAKRGHTVIGIDNNKDKVRQINAGESPIVEPGLGAILSDGVAAGRITATNDGVGAVLQSDITMVSVGTYSSADGFPDLRALYGVMDEIGLALQKKNNFHVVVIRSTVPPGTTTVALDRLTQRSGKTLDMDFGGCMNPEFLREGVALPDFEKPPFIVLGATGERAASVMNSLYQGFDAPVYVTDVKLAEILKYSCNCFHALKVAFGNEVGRICGSLGIDSHELMDIFLKDHILNVSEKYLRPGMPFGGSCLPKDLRGLTSFAKSKGVQTPLLDSVNPSNDSHFAEIIRRIESIGGSRIGIMGVTFKENTDDIRESPIVKLIRCLLDRGYDVRFHDPLLQDHALVGTNRDLLLRVLPEASGIQADSPVALLQEDRMIIFANGSFAKDTTLCSNLTGYKSPILDLHGAYRGLCAPQVYHGLCW